MNAEQLINRVPSPPALSRRVRIVNDPRVVGTVFDVDDSGWIYWVSDDRACHVSAPDYVEACK